MEEKQTNKHDLSPVIRVNSLVLSHAFIHVPLIWCGKNDTLFIFETFQIYIYVCVCVCVYVCVYFPHNLIFIQVKKKTQKKQNSNSHQWKIRKLYFIDSFICNTLFSASLGCSRYRQSVIFITSYQMYINKCDPCVLPAKTHSPRLIMRKISENPQ